MIDEANRLYVTDLSLQDESLYRARFYFNPNSIPMANGNEHVIFQALDGNETPFMRVLFGRTANGYQIRGSFRMDDGSWVDSDGVALSNTIHAIETEWKASV